MSVAARQLATLSALILAISTGSPATACGRDTDCIVDARSYRIVLPEGHDPSQPTGSIIFLHGYRGSADGVLRNSGLADLVFELDIALIVAQASGSDWNVPGMPSASELGATDDVAYIDALAADAVARFGLDPSRMMVSGFSAGAMMVWHLACQRGDVFAGYAPMSGTFWEPLPTVCPGGPTSLIHYHGESDPVVPLAGRPIAQARQGDVRAAIALFADLGGFEPIAPETLGDLRCDRLTDPTGHRLELCLFPGGHSYTVANLHRAADLFAVSAEPE
jgi:polyhydroxybutyrate depolymerase